GRGDATTQSAARLSMSQFISRADAICKQLLDSAGRVPMPSADPEALSAGDLPGVSTYLNAVVPLAKRALARIGALGEPATNSGAVRRLLDQLHASANSEADAARAAGRGDLAGFRVAFHKAEADNQAAADQAHRLGLQVCGQGG